MYESGRRRQTGGKTQSTAAPFAFGFTNVRSPRRGLIICRLEAFEEMSAGADLALCFLRGSTAWMTAWERAAGSRPDDDMVREGVKGEELLMTKDAAKRGGRTAPRVPTWRIALAVGLLAFVCSLTPWPAWAQDRVALVMGNSAYSSEAALPNPTNDAEAMGAALEPLGFQVITVLDAGREEMENALSAFGDLAAEAQVALVFYAGHGGEVDGFGYLLPVDAQLERGPDVQREGVGVDAAIAATFGAQTRIVILDACRQNPFAVTRSVRVEGQGQTRELQPTTSDDGELLIAYATDRGGCPDDGPPGGNSPYTQALLEQLGEEPGVEIGLLFRRVAAAVFEATDGLQQPAVYLTLRDEFYLSAREQENLFWQSIMNSQNPAEFEAYLAQFPNGVFRALAEARLAALRPPGGAGDDHGDSREAATRVVPGRRLAFGTPASATLSGSGSDRWTFTGRADEQVTVELTSEAFDTYLELLGPAGELVMEDDDGGDDLNSLIENQTLDESGDYTVVARAYDDDGGGQYSLLLRRGVSGRRRLVVGTPASATLLGSWSDRWTFTGRAGDQVTVELTSEAFDTYLELLGPAGELVMENDDGGDNRNSLIENQTLDESGDYTVVARAYDDDGGGQYSLLLRRGVSGRRRLVVGTPASATLLGSGSDRWTFTGRAGDQVTVELTSEAFDTYLELLGPAGELVMENDDGGDDRNSLIENQTLDESGDYTVVARAYDGSGDGLYTLSVLTAATDSLRQAITISERYPLEFRRESRDAGYVITNLAHANGRWLMTMTDVSSSDILQFNPTDDSFDEIKERIDEGWRDGYAISDLAVGQGTWAVSMTTGTGLTNQDYIRRSLFPSDWIEDRWDEGRHVTSVAFGDGEWIVVTSGSTGWTNQRFATRSSYNDILTWIEDRWDAGARITDIAHGNGRWAAVASDNTGIGRQSFVRLPSAAFLSSSVEEQRSDGNMVEDVAFDGDCYWILLSAGDAIRWPGSQ